MSELHEAILSGDHEKPYELLKSGFDMNTLDQTGRAPLHLAFEKRRRLLIRHLIHQGAELNIISPEGQTALHLAVENGWNVEVKLLLEKGADPAQKDQNGSTPLDLAKKNENIELIFLLE